MRAAGVWAVAGIYLVYTFIYLVGRDGANGYFWVNNDFFIVPLLIGAFVIGVVMTADGARRYLNAAEGERSIGIFGQAITCLVLTMLFVPYAYVLAFSGYLTG